MNKYKKVESRRVKVFVQYCSACGHPYTYRRVRRILRSWDRDIERLPKLTMRAIRKGFKRVDYGVTEAVKQITDGVRANILLIDELEHYHHEEELNENQ